MKNNGSVHALSLLVNFHHYLSMKTTIAIFSDGEVFIDDPVWDGDGYSSDNSCCSAHACTL